MMACDGEECLVLGHGRSSSTPIGRFAQGEHEGQVSGVAYRCVPTFQRLATINRADRYPMPTILPVATTEVKYR
jgi:hypothetical protein